MGALTRFNAAKPMEIVLDDIAHPEAVRAMLDCVYGHGMGVPLKYNPSTDDVNRDVLRLAQRFQIIPLQDQASQWLASGLTTANLLDRLMACEQFGLTDVRNNILEQLIANPDALFVVAKDPDMTKVPSVLQDLLIRILKLIGADTTPPRASQSQPPPGKAGRKAGA